MNYSTGFLWAGVAAFNTAVLTFNILAYNIATEDASKHAMWAIPLNAGTATFFGLGAIGFFLRAATTTISESQRNKI